MKKVDDINLENKKVILRCDLNVSLKNGVIINDDKITASLKTINYLIKKNAKIIIMSHLGKIKAKDDMENKSLRVVSKRLEEFLPNQNIKFCEKTRGPELEKMINKLNPGDILVMENTRFEDYEGNLESGCDSELSKYWASLGEVFINDAFGLTHRRHSSNYGISLYIESALGLLVESELSNLEVLLNPAHPFTIVMGGAKAEDKINTIENLIDRLDILLLGGALANTFLSVKSSVGKSLVSLNSLSQAKNLLEKYPDKIVLPVDVIVERNGIVMTKFINEILEDDYIYDIGPETIKLYNKYIDKSATVFINGTVGMYENPKFALGTESILQTSNNAKAKVVLGGGDALSSAAVFKLDNFYFKSTGGGATLSYIAGGKLKC